MERMAAGPVAASLFTLAVLAAPGLADPAATSGARQFMMTPAETADPYDPALEAAAMARASDASLVSLRYREKTERPAIRIGREVTVYEAARYRPRRSAPARSSAWGGATQVHGGFFDPGGDQGRGLLFGFRSGPKVDQHVQLGVGLDWRHKSQRYTELIGTGTGPGGEEIEIRRELSRSTSNWVPLQVFAEVNAGRDMGVIPYFGIAGGYQWLGISGDDFSDGSFFDTTFGGWGWQAWGGAAFGIGPRTRLNAEVFLNDADLHRDSIDAFTGDAVRETVRMDGVGMRFGMSWGFF
jgi:hypothetical protein